MPLARSPAPIEREDDLNTLVYLVEIIPGEDTRWLQNHETLLVRELKAFTEATAKFYTTGTMPAVQVTAWKISRGPGDESSPGQPVTPGQSG